MPLTKLTLDQLAALARPVYRQVVYVNDASLGDAVYSIEGSPDTVVINLANWMDLPDTGGLKGAALDGASVTETQLRAATDNALNSARVAKWTYDFAVLGGVVSTIALTGGALPAKAIVFGGLMEVLTPPTSAGAATAAIQTEGANDTITAAVVAGVPWSTVGRKALIPVWSAASALKTTVARTPSIVVGAFNLTAGKFNLFLFYTVSD